MSAVYVTVAVLTAAASAAAAVADYVLPKWLLADMDMAGVPRSWVLPLGHLKLAGALGLLIGLAVPTIGLAAATGLVLFFTGAVVTLIRARCYAQLPFPIPFLLLAAGTLGLHLTSA